MPLSKDFQAAWDILETWAKKTEQERRKLLRPHWERAIEDEWEERDALDTALDELTILEVALQTGSAPEEIQGGLKCATLFKSESFHRYLNGYANFGIRFLADRILGEADLEVSLAQCNTRPRALKAPPVLQALPETFEAFLEIQSNSPETKLGLMLLDDYHWNAQLLSEERIPALKERYSLWLRGLRQDNESASFEEISNGLVLWMKQRAVFYKRFFELQPSGDWIAIDPLCSRFGLVDFYWLAKLWGTEVWSNGTVKPVSRPWVRDVLSKTGVSARERRAIEQILRGVFDYTCDLVQNASQIREEEFDRKNAPANRIERPPEVVGWRYTVDEELAEVDLQRQERQMLNPTESRKSQIANAESVNQRRIAGWSDRFFSRKNAPDPIGVAISGGGIRSATFALGILQGLRDLDLLRHVDYLSTVSGGGFIGSWLVGNVRRTPFWLSKVSNWDESISHLRRFSNYLAPKTGLMSADSWTMWGIWMRNAFLVQLTAFAWLAFGVTLVRVLKFLFVTLSAGQVQMLGFEVEVSYVLRVCVAWIAIAVCWNLRHPTRENWVRRGLVLPAWIAAFLTATLLWNQATIGPLQQFVYYSDFLKHAWPIWKPTLVLLGICFLSVGLTSVRMQPWPWIVSLFGALFATGVAYLELCGLMLLFKKFSALESVWVAYLFGPVLVLIAVTTAVHFQIGITGNLAQEGKREWWTRFGSWLGILGVAFHAASLASVLGPPLVFWIAGLGSTMKWGTALTWIGTIVGGLMAGNSDETRGNGEGGAKKMAIDLVARVAGFLFIVGGVLLGATLVHVTMVQMWIPDPIGLPWNYLDQLELLPLLGLAISCSALLLCALLFSWRFDLNTFGLNYFYRNRLVRCYLGATRWRAGWRDPNKFTGFDDKDDLNMPELLWDRVYDGVPFRGPFPIVNCSLNLGGSSDLALHTRRSASFSLTPLRCGSDRRKIGYAPAKNFAKGVTLGEAVSISGAAASPNMGYNTSPLASFLLTLFNVRLGWWFPNPGKKWWNRQTLGFGGKLLFSELFGLAGEDSKVVNVSDGGHFENLAIYELIRRRAKIIIASDGECDPGLTFGSLGNLIRICETDFGAKIDLNVDSLRLRDDTKKSAAHCAVGVITYCNGSQGYLIYLKATLVGEEDAAVLQYHAGHPTFPHETTGDQFFSEDQFESYRRLGRHEVLRTFRGTEGTPIEIARQLFDIWAPEGIGANVFVKHSEKLDRIWERLRTTPALAPLVRELLANAPGPPPQGPIPDPVTLACAELLQLMEDVFLELRLDDFWDLPDNRGWALLFTQWAQSSTFQAVWPQLRNTYGIRFEYFCARRLGLPQSAIAARA